MSIHAIRDASLEHIETILRYLRCLITLINGPLGLLFHEPKAVLSTLVIIKIPLLPSLLYFVIVSFLCLLSAFLPVLVTHTGLRMLLKPFVQLSFSFVPILVRK